MTESQVKAAWAMLQQGQSQASVARALRIPQPTLHAVIARQTWCHVTAGLGELPPARQGGPRINQEPPATADSSDLPDRPREPRQRPYKRSEPIPVDDPAGRDFLHRELTTIRKIMHRYGGSP
jgi:hypothetical protein